VANLVAAKLVRADPKDLEDIAFLLSRYQPSRPEIERAIRSVPSAKRQKAAANLVYLEVMGQNQP
jgi:hypothetical protein